MSDYSEVERLAQYLLQESYVLSIQAAPGELALEMDLALTSAHPQYGPAASIERHCYRRGVMRYLGVSALHWVDQGTPPARDATGELDYGNIDSLAIEGNSYDMVGDFGHIVVVASNISIRLHT